MRVPGSPPRQPQVLADLGDLLVSKHDTEVALGCYAESVRLAPGVADAWLKLGIARGEEGDIHAAIDPCGAAWILARGSGLSSGPGPYSHFEGWISSCYYVSLPDAVSDSGSHAGWLEFGETNLQLGNLECVEKIVQPRRRAPGAVSLVLVPRNGPLFLGRGSYHHRLRCHAGLSARGTFD